VAMTLKTVLAHAAEHPIAGALVFLDQEKAYDRVSHSYLATVLHTFGFPSSLAQIFMNTSGVSDAYIMDEGQPLDPVTVACGVRQGDPLAPLLFNLAVEPLIASLRQRLTGLTLPWGSFIAGAFADDLTIGLAHTDFPVLNQVLTEYGQASNGRVNVHKSTILDLSASVHPPAWIQQTGFAIQDPSSPFRVLGFDLALSAEGVQEDWTALTATMHTTAQSLLTRSCALRGRALLAKSLVLSQLWYKGQLSAPSPAQLTNLRQIGLLVVWGGRAALKPGQLVARRPRHFGGVGFLDPATQLQALQARWIARFLSARPRPPWWGALNHVLSTYNGGRSSLAMPSTGRAVYQYGSCWAPFLKAWYALHPQWTMDITDWTSSQALAFPVPKTTSRRSPTGLRLYDLVTQDHVTGTISLLTGDDITPRDFGAPARVRAALAALQSSQSAVPPFILQLALSPSSSAICRSAKRSLHTNISDAEVPLLSFSSCKARRFLDSGIGL
jgi:hypothetical protein